MLTAAGSRRSDPKSTPRRTFMTTHADATLSRPAPPGKWRWVVFAGVLGPLAAGLCLLGLYLYRAHVEEQELRDAVAEADRLDPHWRLAELLDARVPVPDDENSATVVVSPVVVVAGRSLGVWVPPFVPVKSTDTDFAIRVLPPQELLPAELAESLRAALKKAEAGLPTARRLADMPRGRHAVNWTPDFINTMLTHLNDVRPVARLLDLDAVMR